MASTPQQAFLELALVRALTPRLEEELQEDGWTGRFRLYMAYDRSGYQAATPALREVMEVPEHHTGIAMTELDVKAHPTFDDSLPALLDAICAAEIPSWVRGIFCCYEDRDWPTDVVPGSVAQIFGTPQMHPRSRRFRVVVGVLRSGANAAVLRYEDARPQRLDLDMAGQVAERARLTAGFLLRSIGAPSLPSRHKISDLLARLWVVNALDLATDLVANNLAVSWEHLKQADPLYQVYRSSSAASLGWDTFKSLAHVGRFADIVAPKVAFFADTSLLADYVMASVPDVEERLGLVEALVGRPAYQQLCDELAARDWARIGTAA